MRKSGQNKSVSVSGRLFLNHSSRIFLIFVSAYWPPYSNLAILYSLSQSLIDRISGNAFRNLSTRSLTLIETSIADRPFYFPIGFYFLDHLTSSILRSQQKRVIEVGPNNKIMCEPKPTGRDRDQILFSKKGENWSIDPIFVICMKYLLPLVTIVGILSIASQARADFNGKIISVGDGDTLAVQSSSGKVTIRLACIDAPERAQAPMGAVSTQYLKSLVPVNSNVRIREIENDKYGRKVAEVFSGTDSINLRMVKAGHAAVYRQYLSGCSQTKQQFLDAENSAKKARRGIWGQGCMIMPWDFQRGKNTCSIQGNSPKSGYQGFDGSPCHR